MKCSMLFLLPLLIVYLKVANCDVIVLPENEYEGSLCYLGNRTRGQCRKSCPDLNESEYKDNICNPGKSPTLYCCFDSSAAKLYPTLYNACLDRILAENMLRRFERYHEKTQIHHILRRGFIERVNFIKADCEARKMKVEADERGAYLRLCLRRLAAPLPEITGLIYKRELQDVAIAGLGFRSRKGGKIRWICTGYYVSPVYVLTSAHCFIGTGDIPNIVRHGRANLTHDVYDTRDEGGWSTHPIVNVIVHEQYDEETNYADIALAKVFRDVASETKVQLKPAPACLWTKKRIPKPSLAVVGYDESIHQGFPSAYTPGTCKIDENLPQDTVVCWACGFSVNTKVIGFLLYSERLRQEVHYIYGVGSGAYPCRKTYDGALFTYVYPYLEWIENVISRVN